ncbi:MAG: acyltransferase family protein [Bacteroidales bacterium]|jgi:surface polysaccharide O-acyltransferase-like enzyme|nr:acyltransferase family protein [Bacteroidales bacterium]
MKTEIFWIDKLRILATLGVILLHTSSGTSYNYGNIPNLSWWVGNIFDSAGRFAVPVFLMISGALILSKTYDNIGEYLKKRVVKILLPFLFWSLIYIVKNLFLAFYNGTSMSFIEILKFVIMQFKYGASFHFWYIYMLIGLYLFFPIIGKWIKKSSACELKYFLGIWLLTTFIHFPFISKVFPNVDLAYFSGYIGFPVLGYYLANKTSSDFRIEKRRAILLILTGFLITVLGTFFIAKYNGHFSDTLYKPLSPQIILIAAGMFLLFKSSSRNPQKYSTILLFFSKYCYGIFLIHPFILEIMEKIHIQTSLIHPILSIPLICVLCFLFSMSIIWCVNKLPFGKYISG